MHQNAGFTWMFAGFQELAGDSLARPVLFVRGEAVPEAPIAILSFVRIVLQA